MVLLFDSAFMLLSAGISYFNGIDGGFAPLLLSFIFTAIIGGFPLIFVGKTDRLSSKESYSIVIGGWLASCLVGTLPFVLWGGEFSIINAWFESVSGFTATGASILNDIEALPKGILFWRSAMHWIGGIGIVMFALVIMPMMGRSRMAVSNLEISSMAKDDYHYRSSKIMRILLGVYLGMTIINTVALKLAGMGWFDAANHAMSTIATGGFSTKNASIGAFDSISIEMVTIFFMFVSSIHYGIIYATIIGGKNNVFRSENTKFYINPTGRFVVGGPHGDSGLTGRKIIVDTYGGYASHGGGAFSGKDPTKVDRSAAYMARYVAKNIVAAGAADRCEVQIAYAIGVARPLSVLINTNGTGKVSDERLAEIVNEVFDLRPAAIIETLDLRKPIYKNLAAYGHFGREELGVKWEIADKADEIRARI